MTLAISARKIANSKTHGGGIGVTDLKLHRFCIWYTLSSSEIVRDARLILALNRLTNRRLSRMENGMFIPLQLYVRKYSDYARRTRYVCENEGRCNEFLPGRIFVDM